MKTTWLLLGTLLLLPPLVRAQTCPGLSYSQGPTYNDVSDVTDHVSGDHLFDGIGTGTCLYSSYSPPQTYCQTDDVAIVSVTATDSGEISGPLGLGLGYHVSNTSTTAGESVANGSAGTISATGIGVAAWEWCLLKSCSFSVTSNPVSVPASAVWSHTYSVAFSCVAKKDPGTGGGGGCVTLPDDDDDDDGGGGGGCGITAPKSGIKSSPSK